MANPLSGKTIAFLVAPEGIEQVELTEPWKAVEEAGGTPRLVSTEAGKVQAFNHLDRADQFDVDVTVWGTSAGEYAGLALPGGVANPDLLAEPEDRPAQRRRRVGRRGGRRGRARGRCADHQPPAR
jgi:protease I